LLFILIFIGFFVPNDALQSQYEHLFILNNRSCFIITFLSSGFSLEKWVEHSHLDAIQDGSKSGPRF
jgi:hypothetical protein